MIDKPRRGCSEIRTYRGAISNHGYKRKFSVIDVETRADNAWGPRGCKLELRVVRLNIQGGLYTAK